MNTRIWRKLWAFLNQVLFEQNSAEVKPDLQLLERCWNMLYIQEFKPDLQLLERCWNKPCVQSKSDRYLA
jgi:hypothetical protein